MSPIKPMTAHHTFRTSGQARCMAGPTQSQSAKFHINLFFYSIEFQLHNSPLGVLRRVRTVPSGQLFGSMRVIRLTRITRVERSRTAVTFASEPPLHFAVKQCLEPFACAVVHVGELPGIAAHVEKLVVPTTKCVQCEIPLPDRF